MCIKHVLQRSERLERLPIPFFKLIGARSRLGSTNTLRVFVRLVGADTRELLAFVVGAVVAIIAGHR